MNPQFDTDTQSRIQRAMASGMSQDKATRLGMMYQMQKQSTQAAKTPAPAAPQKTTTEKIAGALPFLGGIAGSLIPVLGPIVGGAAGAAAGKLLGNVAINHDTSATNNRSALQGVGTEAALGLAGGVAAKGISALAEPILGKIAGSAGKAVVGGERVAQDVAQTAAQTAVSDGSNYTLSNAAKKKLIASANKQMAPGYSLTKADEEALIKRMENQYVQSRYGKLPTQSPTVQATPEVPVATDVVPQAPINTGPQDLASRILRGNGQSMRRSVALPKVGADPYMIRTSDQLIADAQAAGLKPGSNSYQLKQMPAIMDKLKAESDVALSQSTDRVPTNKVISQLHKVIQEDPALLHDKNAVQEAKTLVTQHAMANSTNGTMGAKQIADLKSVMGGSQRMWDKMKKGTPLSPGEEAFHSAWESLDKVITDMVPAAKDATLKMSKLYKIAPGLAKGMDRNMKIPMVDMQIPGTASLAQGVGDRIGNAMIKMGDATPGFLQNATGQGFTHSFGIGGNGDQSNTTGDQSAPSSLADATTQLENNSQTTDTSGQDASQTSGGTGLTNDIISALMMADLKSTGGKHISDLATLAKFAVPDATKTKIGATQMDMIVAGQSAQAHLNELEKLIASDGSFSTGRSQMFKQGARKIFGTGIVPSKDAELKFNNVANNLLSEYVKMISGAAATDAEREFIKSYIPSITDSPQEIRAKIDELKRSIAQKTSTLAAATGRYDVTNAAQAATQ